MKQLDLIFTTDVITKVEGAVIAAAIVGAYKYIQDFIRSRRLMKRLEEDRYTSTEIKKRAVRNRATYVRPDCQDNNPANPGPDVNRRPIFQEVDRLLDEDQPARFTLILADTGMDKSTFLERYYAYRWRSPRRYKRFKPVVIPLNGLDADELIKEIDKQARDKTVLLLDALDEDNAAIGNFAQRFDELVKLAGKFRAVVVTCRIQFLTDVACVPKEIDLPAPSGPMPLSTSSDRMVRPLYLSPFSDAQVKKYLAARFPYWRHPVLRARAKRTAERFKDLMSRPLLLTFIQELASTSEEPKYSFQAYRIIVESWLEREKNKHRLTIPPENLLRFSEEFAVSLFTTGRDRAPTAELQSMAECFGVGPVFREVRERSLLHNDAEGNWKFVHRSILEYLVVVATSMLKAPPPWAGKPWNDRKFVHRAILEYLVVVATSMLKAPPPWAGKPWTDQMRRFASEMLRSGENNRLSGADLHGLDLKGVDLSSRDLSDLSGANLDYVDLSDANLTEARLVNASFDQANLRGASLDRTDLRGVNLRKVHGLTLLQATAAIADRATIWPARTLAGHSSWVYGVAVTPDGRRAVSASHDTTLKVWDLETGSELRTLAGHSREVTAVAVTPDGRHAISASWDTTLKVWDLETGSELRTLAGHTGNVRGVAVTPDGRRAVSASEDDTLKVWDLASGRELRTLAVYAGPHTAVAVTPDGRRAVSASGYTLKVWDLETGRELRILAVYDGVVTAVAVTPDGRRVVSASRDTTLEVWDLETGSKLRTLRGHSNWVTVALQAAVAVTPDGRRAVSTSDDDTLKVWDLETGREVLTLAGHSNSVCAVAVTPDGRSVVSASDDKTLRVWFPSDKLLESLSR